MKTAWSKYTAYRLNFFLQIIGPTVIFFFVKYNLWSSIYAPEAVETIKGYNFQQMISYHGWAMIAGLLVQGHSALDLSSDIRLGRISSYLIYPFSFFRFHTASFLAFQALQTFIASLTLIILSACHIIDWPSPQAFVFGLFFSSLAGLFWFSLQYLTGLFSFWLEETWMLRVILKMIATFLSGAIIPLELYPSWLFQIINYSPFPYLTYYPIKIFSGDFQYFYQACTIIVSWILAMCLINSFLWRRGLKMYTAAGM